MPDSPTAPTVDPLISLGLIDVSRIDIHDRTDEERAYDAAQAKAQAPAVQSGAAPTTGIDWESDDNPYKQAIAARGGDQGPSLSTQLAELRGAAAELVPQVTAALIARGTNEADAPAIARDYVNAQAAAFATQLRADADKREIFKTGAVQKAAAEKIAQQVSTKEVKVTAKELESAPTIEAMRERANVLISTRRDAGFQARTARGADRAEGGSGSGGVNAEVLDKMSPSQKIAYGIKHGKY